MAKKMSSGPIDKNNLKTILEAGIRVPDHGALNPWKLVVIQGNSLKKMYLSSGAVCMNLLSCAQSKGFAAQWLTEWYAYNEKMLSYLGGRIGMDKISGFIYIGHKNEDPNERRRPNSSDVIEYI